MEKKVTTVRGQRGQESLSASLEPANLRQMAMAEACREAGFHDTRFLKIDCCIRREGESSSHGDSDGDSLDVSAGTYFTDMYETPVRVLAYSRVSPNDLARVLRKAADLLDREPSLSLVGLLGEDKKIPTFQYPRRPQRQAAMRQL